MEIKDLEKFCRRSSPREYIASVKIEKPWSAREFTFATNGYVIVPVPRKEDVPEGGKEAPEVNTMFLNLPNPKWFCLPENLPEKQDCKTCNGEGKNFECPECGGTGEIIFYKNGHDYEADCKECDGNGKIATCEDCAGTGKEPAKVGVEIEGVKFQAWLLSLLKTLPNCLISPGGHQLPAQFKFDGGDGLIMSLRN